jgi:hypothetical protein
MKWEEQSNKQLSAIILPVRQIFMQSIFFFVYNSMAFVWSAYYSKLINFFKGKFENFE